MMNPLPQTVPISHLRQRQDEILAMAEAGPVLLLSRSEPAAVLLSPAEWDTLATELDELRTLKQTEDDRVLAERIAQEYIVQAAQSSVTPEALSQTIQQAIQADRLQRQGDRPSPIPSSEMSERMRASGVNV